MFKFLTLTLSLLFSLVHHTAAKKTDHWSLLPIKTVQIPETISDPWVKNPIDAFILHKLKKRGMTPQPSAPAITIMRRLYAGLTGILPEIDEINKRVNSGKILLELFTCSGMIKIKPDLCENSYKEYVINYIKCARFCLVEEIWKQLEIHNLEKNISEIATYIMDFDNFVSRDFNSEIKAKYGEMKAVFCWKGASSNDNFTKNLHPNFHRLGK